MIALGGGGWVGASRQNLQRGDPNSYIQIRCSAVLHHNKEYIMYTVSILWGSKAVTHTAWSKSSAIAWLYQYPKEDMFGKVTDIFGRSIAVRYYR